MSRDKTNTHLRSINGNDFNADTDVDSKCVVLI